jgi:1,4-alpha-glucan branching enzyme
VVPPNVSYSYEAVTGTVIGQGTGFSTGGEGSSTVQTVEGTIFTADFPDADSVSLAGDFNNWDPNANPMTKDAAGLWKATVDLKPGTYHYKFVVDGTWTSDPNNSDTVDDGYGGVNSVLTVE